jgi:hypothetical protein
LDALKGVAMREDFAIRRHCPSYPGRSGADEVEIGRETGIDIPDQDAA